MAKPRQKTGVRVISWILFIVYLAVLAYFLFFADMLGRTDAAQSYSSNLVLFREIRRFWVYRSQIGFGYVFLNLAGNILVFIPFGLLLPLLSTKLRGFFRVVLLGLAFSVVVECIQLVTKTGCFDVDDMLLNTIGAAVGFIIYAIVQHRRKKKGRRRKTQRKRKA